ncbi:MAG: RHS repeat protein [Deltaproteobacteria bacterium]|nr:RHS repeat protein [Deltaproteobacteria bacterium]
MERSLSSRYRRVFIYLLAVLSVFYVLPILESYAGIVSYSYDELERLTQESYEDGTTIIFTYDEVGNRLTKEVLTGNSSGITVLCTGQKLKGCLYISYYII